MRRGVVILVPVALAAVLGACDGDPTASRGEPAARDEICGVIESEVVTAVTNAEEGAAPQGDLVDALSGAQGRLRELGMPLLGGAHEDLARQLIEVSGAVSRVRLAVIEAHEPSVAAAADQVRALLEREPLRTRCGDIPLGEA